jgi:hypothetical protein
MNNTLQIEVVDPHTGDREELEIIASGLPMAQAEAFQIGLVLNVMEAA